METLRKRLRRVEKEAQFRRWLEFSRLLENLSDSQIEDIAIYFRFPDPMPEPLPIGMSKLDGLDRKTLLAMWEQEEKTISRIMRELKGRNEEEHRFYCVMGLARGNTVTRRAEREVLRRHLADARRPNS